MPLLDTVAQSGIPNRVLNSSTQNYYQEQITQQTLNNLIEILSRSFNKEQQLQDFLEINLFLKKEAIISIKDESQCIVAYEYLSRIESPHAQIHIIMQYLYEKGLTYPFFETLLKSVIKDMKNGISLPKCVSLNVYAEDIGNKKFVDMFEAQRKKSKLEATLFSLEILEYSKLVDDSQGITKDNILRLKTLGYKISIDDFNPNIIAADDQKKLKNYSSDNLDFLNKIGVNPYLLKLDGVYIRELIEEFSKNKQEFICKIHTLMTKVKGSEIVAEQLQSIQHCSLEETISIFKRLGFSAAQSWELTDYYTKKRKL